MGFGARSNQIIFRRGNTNDQQSELIWDAIWRRSSLLMRLSALAQGHDKADRTNTTHRRPLMSVELVWFLLATICVGLLQWHPSVHVV